MMQFAHLILRPRYSGAEMLVIALSRVHADHMHFKPPVLSLAPAAENFLPEIKKIEQVGVLVMLPPSEKSSIGRLIWLMCSLLESRCKVVFAHSLIPSFYARAVGAILGIRVVTVLHDASQDDFKPLKFRLLENVFSFLSAATISVAARAKENYKKRVWLPAPAFVIPNGIDTAKFAFSKECSKKNTIIQVGRISQLKGQMTTLQALQHLKERGIALKVLFAGLIEDPAYFQELISFVRNHSLEQQVEWLGPRSDIHVLIPASHVYVMPSLSEGFSVALIEALSTGIPVVLSQIGPFEFAREYQNVQLVQVSKADDFSAAILRALDQVRCPRDVSSYTIEKTACDYQCIAQSLTEPSFDAV